MVTFRIPGHISRHIAFYFTLLQLIVAQSVYDPAQCVSGSGVTTFANCNYLDNELLKCGSEPPTSFIPCYCNQAYFNAIFGCESETRLCLGHDGLDGSSQSEVSGWHDICDGASPFSPTTPQLSSIVHSVNPDECTTVFSACNAALAILTSCSLYSASQFGSCVCQPSMIAVEYTCEYIGNISCAHRSAALSDLDAYQSCSNFAAVLASMPAITSAAATTVASGSGSFSNTKPSLPSNTRTKSSASVGRYILPRWILLVCCLPLLFVLG